MPNDGKQTMDIFETICMLAKDKSEQELNALIKSGFCIDLTQNEMTPVMWLAKEGDTASVEFLIDKFQARINFAMQGYAMRGDTIQVENLIKQGASLNYAVEGYAIGGFQNEVDDLIARGASINYAVQGYARGDHHDMVQDLLNRGASLDYVLRGYAINGQREQVEKIFHRSSIFPQCAAWAYARGGNFDEVDQLISRGVSLDLVVLGYARGGYKEQVDNLIARGANLTSAAVGYAIGGHSAQVEELLAKGASLKKVVKGYARGGHVKQVEDLLARGASLKSAVAGYAYGGHDDKVNDLIARGADPSKAMEYYARGGHEDQVNYLVAKGEGFREAAFGYAVRGHLEMLLRVQNANNDPELYEFINRMIDLARVVNITVLEQSSIPRKIPTQLPIACIIPGFEIGKDSPISFLNQLDDLGIVNVYVLLNSDEYAQAQNTIWTNYDDYYLLTALEHYKSHRTDSQLKFHLIDVGNARTEEDKLLYYLNSAKEQYLMNIVYCKNSVPWIPPDLNSRMALMAPIERQLAPLPFISWKTRDLPSVETPLSTGKAMELIQREKNPCICFQANSKIDTYHYQWLFNVFVELVALEINQNHNENVTSVVKKMTKLIKDYGQNISDLEKAELKHNERLDICYGHSAPDSPSTFAKWRLKKSSEQKDYYEEKFTTIIAEMANIYQTLALQKHGHEDLITNDSYRQMGEIIKTRQDNQSEKHKENIKQKVLFPPAVRDDKQVNVHDEQKNIKPK